MTSLTEGYSCPICEIVLDDEECPDHPGLPVDLHLRPIYSVCHVVGEPWEIFRWDDAEEQTTFVCKMPSPTDLDEQNASRIAVVLGASSEISTEALSAGYIQTLQQLPLFVSDHLSAPTAATKERLYQQLALIDFRGRANSTTGNDENFEDDGNRFDLLVAQPWKETVWIRVNQLLLAAGYVIESRATYFKTLANDRIAQIYLDEKNTNKSITITARVGICHESLITTMQSLQSEDRSRSFETTLLSSQDVVSYTFYDDSEDSVTDFARQVIASSDRFFDTYQGLDTICLGLVKKCRHTAFTLPVALAFLGKYQEALDCSQDWVCLWKKHPRNDEFVQDYQDNFIVGLKKIKPID